MGCWVSVRTMKKIPFFPLSLRARILWLVLISVVAAQGLTLYAIFWHQRNHVQSAAVNMLVTSIRTLQSAMQFVPDEQRAAFVQMTSQGEWRLRQHHLPKEARLQSLKGLQTAPAGPRQVRESLRRLSKDINRALGEKSQVAIMASGKPTLYVSLGERQWLEIPLDRVDPPVTNNMIIGWLVSMLGLLVIAMGFSWRITEPIARLAKATQQLAQGKPEPVKPAGPREVRQLGEGFNAMLHALKQSQQTQRTLLAGLPHDLKGPLSRMALRIEMTEDEELKAGLKRDLADMQRMVEQFLDFIRGQDADRLNLKPVRLDQWLMHHVTDDQQLGKPVEMLAQSSMGENDLLPVTVLADALALDRIWSNLINNAREHGEPPIDVCLYVEKTENSQQSEWVVLTISDHGQGIASHDIERAFEPFERLDNARTRTGSVGLGLSLVRGIVLAHGGTISLLQSPHGGLQVRVMLPIMNLN